MLELLLEQFKGSEWTRPLVAGGWGVLACIFQGRRALGPVALKLDIFGIATAQLRAIGSDGSWVVSLLSWVACVA